MFTLKIHDRNGIELKEGDIVKVHNNREFVFFSEVKWLEQEQAIAPFHTFAFHSFEKVDSVPESAIKSNEERYNVWYLEQEKEDPKLDFFEKYRIGWLECEHELDNRSYRITKTPSV